MVELKMTVKDSYGLVKCSGWRFIPGQGIFSYNMQWIRDCNITLCCGDKRANAKAGMSVCAINVKDGDQITFLIEGENEEEAAEKVVDYCKELGVI